MGSAVALINPKYAHNVGGVLRACACFQASHLAWTPERVTHPKGWPRKTRLPREERMKAYWGVSMFTPPREQIISAFDGYTPVAVEVRENAERLPNFVHPENALYIFGPEDGSLDRGILSACHRFVVIPATSCLNLAASVNVVLYDRLMKIGEDLIPHLGRQYVGVEE